MDCCGSMAGDSCLAISGPLVSFPLEERRVSLYYPVSKALHFDLLINELLHLAVLCMRCQVLALVVFVFASGLRELPAQPRLAFPCNTGFDASRQRLLQTIHELQS